MLESISIKNVALIKDLNIEFGQGLNILLGETGAGKSIIFDALNFVLGAKADKTLIRSGEEQMRVDAVFTGLSEYCLSRLQEYGIEENEVALSRTLNIDGKSSVRVNGLPTTAGVLKEIGKCLLDSYSQHESVELLNPKMHLPMLDRFGGEKIKQQKEEVKRGLSQCNEIRSKIASLGGDEFERERTRSLYEYQVNEIEEADLKIGEDGEVSNRLKFLNSSEKIYEAVSACEEYLSGNVGSCLPSLENASNSLSSIMNFENVAQCKQRLESAKYEIEDVYETLLEIKSSTEFDEKEFDKLDRRNDTIRSLTKKYGGSIEKVLEYLSQIKQKLNDLEDSEFLLSKYQKEYEKAHADLMASCEQLSLLRKNVAKDIENKIVCELKELGMKSSQFIVNFEKLEEPTQYGIDKIEFVFSANKGQEVKSLSKTASGGELSRFMLAVKNIFAEIGSAQTLVFDEIDSGISGETGNIVGKKLSNLTNFAQVLCITHLPQVACYGDDFFFVSKFEDEHSTQTCIKNLVGEEIPLNIAKMIVGQTVSETALSQAKELRLKAGK